MLIGLPMTSLPVEIDAERLRTMLVAPSQPTR